MVMVMLGWANSRIKHVYDLAVIERRTELDAATLTTTLVRRLSALPVERP